MVTRSVELMINESFEKVGPANVVGEVRVRKWGRGTQRSHWIHEILDVLQNMAKKLISLFSGLVKSRRF